MAIKKRLLAVGGIHIFENQKPCRLLHTEPEDSVKNLKWKDTLALEALHEGTADLACGIEELNLEIVQPARLVIEMVSDANPSNIQVLDRFKVQVRLYDSHGRELEVGKFTKVEWFSSSIFEIANDPSAGEFGYCDTCFGMQSFRAITPGKGLIEACLGRVRGTLSLAVGSNNEVNELQVKVTIRTISEKPGAKSDK